MSINLAEKQYDEGEDMYIPSQEPAERFPEIVDPGDKRHKVLDLHDLAEVLEGRRAAGRRIVHCHGVFDLLHIGHIRYFSQAQQMGDVLVVTVTPDRFVDKGPHRPAFPESLRAEAVASLHCVDYVAINLWPTAEETLRLLRPHVYVKGSEFRQPGSDLTRKIDRERAVVEEIGAEIAFTEDIVFSSTNLINRYLSSMPAEIQNYLDLFRRRHSVDEMLSWLDHMAALKVLVVGDTILDEYQYCEAIGKSSKDPLLALKYNHHDLFAGGVLAVANHVSGFAGRVDLLTMIGDRDSHEDFIRSSLRPNVRPRFVVQAEAPTLIKRRFIDGYSTNKLFEVYVMDDSGPSEQQSRESSDWLRSVFDEYDIVISADFGHGAITQAMVDAMVDGAPFLAAMTQANAGNRGFHTVTRYGRADYACLSEHELRLERRDLRGDIRPMMEHLSRGLGAHQFVTTRGRKGCLVIDRDGQFMEVPAFATRVVDRVGSGDAFFAVSSLASRLGASSEVLGFLGNVVGSLAVEMLGNAKPIDKGAVQKYLVSLLK